MATTKKSSKPRQSKLTQLKLRPWHLVIALALFIAGGFVIAYSRAASDATLDSGTLSALHLELGSGAQTVERNDGEDVVTQGPKIVDLSPAGDLSCFENNANSGMGKHLSSAEITSVIESVKKAGLVTVPTNSNSAVDVQVLRYVDPSTGKVVTYNLDAATTASSAYSKAIQALETVCNSGNKPVKHKDLPRYKVKKNQALANPVQEVLSQLVPVAHAGTGAATSNPYIDYVNAVNAQLLSRTNATRTQQGLRPVSADPCLYTSAASWSTNMATTYNNAVVTYANKNGSSDGYVPYIWHSNPLAALIDPQCGPNWRWIGEIVGYVGVNNMQTPATQAADIVFDAYMNSPGHRAIIMYPAATNFNFGTVLTSNNKAIFNTGHFMMR